MRRSRRHGAVRERGRPGAVAKRLSTALWAALSISAPQYSLAQTPPPSTTALLAGFGTGASSEDYQQVAAAIGSSDALQQQLRRAQLDGRLQGIRLKRDNDPVIAPSPFKAFVAGPFIYLSDAFLQEQKQNQFYDVRIQNQINPNSLVFALGHLAYHLDHAKPRPPTLAPGQALDIGALVHGAVLVEAGAYIQGWNDMVNAAATQNGGRLSAPQIGQLLLNLRYRPAFLKAIKGETKLVIQSDGTIPASPENLDAMTAALGTTQIADFE